MNSYIWILTFTELLSVPAIAQLFFLDLYGATYLLSSSSSLNVVCFHVSPSALPYLFFSLFLPVTCFCVCCSIYNLCFHKTSLCRYSIKLDAPIFQDSFQEWLCPLLFWHSISMLDLCFEMQQNCLLYLTKIVSVLANYFYGCRPNAWQETSQGRAMICP